MQPLIPFDSLSDREQTEVLKYIEATNIQTVDDAIRVLIHHNMKADEALRTNHNSQIDSSFASFYTAEQQEEIAEYSSFLREEESRRVSCTACFKGCGRALKRLFKRMVPKCVRRLFRKNTFEEIYQSYSQVNLFQGQIQQKPICLFISKSFSKKMGYILHTEQTSTILNNRFVCLGLTDHKSNYLQHLLEDITQPCVIVLYRNIFGKNTVIGKYGLDSVDKPLLQNVIQQYRSQRRHEKNIVIRYNNKLMMTYFQNQAAQNYIQDQLPENNDIYQSKTIRDQQTRQYQQASQLHLKQQRQQQENKKKIQDMLYQRSVRKTSISQEPDHNDIVVLNFRCPAGNKLKRKFGLDEIVENIYTWVETNEEIEFEEDPIRNFDLLRGYPPQSMEGVKGKTIREAFEEDKYQIITIKEI